MKMLEFMLLHVNNVPLAKLYIKKNILAYFSKLLKNRYFTPL